jgi:hypothetical protein
MGGNMRVSFVTEKAARAAVNAFVSYGYAADRIGNDVVTDCPSLLAVSSIEREIGFGQIERLDLSKSGGPLGRAGVSFRDVPEREVAPLGASPDASTGYLPACASA